MDAQTRRGLGLVALGVPLLVAFFVMRLNSDGQGDASPLVGGLGFLLLAFGAVLVARALFRNDG